MFGKERTRIGSLDEVEWKFMSLLRNEYFEEKKEKVSERER